MVNWVRGWGGGVNLSFKLSAMVNWVRGWGVNLSFKLSPMANLFFVSTCYKMFQNVVKVQYYLNPIKDNLHWMEMTKLYCYVESI